MYIAPEVLLNRGHDKGADHWSLGILIYELICGFTPFYTEGMEQVELFRAIAAGKYSFPEDGTFSADAKDICLRLLVSDPSNRLGSLAAGPRDIFRAKWFDSVDFHKLKRKELRSPWCPTISDPLDTSNFDDWSHLEDRTKVTDPPISERDAQLFASF